MDRNATLATLLGLLEEATGSRPSNLTDATDLRADLGLDSVDLISLVLQVENHFDVRIDSDELPGLRTAGDVLDLLARKTAAGPGRAAA